MAGRSLFHNTVAVAQQGPEVVAKGWWLNFSQYVVGWSIWPRNLAKVSQKISRNFFKISGYCSKLV